MVNTTNANPFMSGTDAAGDTVLVRAQEQDAFVTNPFVEPPAKSGSPGTTPVCGTAQMAALSQELQKNFPVSCRFANYTQDVQTIRDDTEVVCIAPVPVCLQEKNWKEY